MTIDERIQALIRDAELRATEQHAMDERIGALTMNLELHAAEQAAMAARHAEMAKQQAEMAKQQAEMDRRLTRAIRAGVREARRIRRVIAARDAESRAGFAELRRSQDETQASLKAFIDSLRESRNGH